MTRSNRLRLGALPAVVLAAACASPVAQALRLDLTTGIAGEYSSNILRTERNEENELIGIVWGGISAREEAANLTAELAAVVESRQYINDTVGDEILLSLAALSDWMILPQRLNWHFEDYFQQSTINPLETISPDNRQDTNVLWTGPDLYFRFARLYTLQLGARYGNFYYEETDGDNQRLAGYGRAIRRLSPDGELYLHGEWMHADYDHAGATDVLGITIRNFDRTDAYAGYRWSSVLTELLLEGGYSRIERDGAEAVDEPLARLTLRRALPRDGETGLRLSSQLTEGGGRLLASSGGRFDVDPHSTAVSQDIALERFAELFYFSRWRGVGTDIRVFWRDEDYEESIFDERAAGIALYIGYPFAPAWVARLFGRYEHVDFDLIDRKDHRAALGIGAFHRLSRRITIDFELRDEWQDSNTAGHDFNEIIALVELRYGERPSWAPAR